MADKNNVEVTVSGIVPSQKGSDPEYGNWFIIDESGEFSVDKNIIATIWIVGGGCDGGSGIWNGNRIDVKTTDKKTQDGGNIPIPNTGTGTSYSGAGGDGGYVYTLTDVKISKNQTLSSVIAGENNQNGTSLNIGNAVYRCDESGYVPRTGGKGGSLPKADVNELWADQKKVNLPTSGDNGVKTPYGYVGSSGGGGAACNGTSDADNGIIGGEGAGSGTSHRGKGTDAVNYGCGGGGGAFCGRVAVCPTENEYIEISLDDVENKESYLGYPVNDEDRNNYANYHYKGWFGGGKGKQGCIIIAYTIDPTQNTLVVQKHYKKVCNTHKTCKTDYYSNNSHKTCCGNGSYYGSCGCSGNKSGYTDTIHIGKSSIK